MPVNGVTSLRWYGHCTWHTTVLFVGTTLVGGVLALWAIVRLAREKSRHTTAGDES
jgi:hypothetical protein